MKEKARAREWWLVEKERGSHVKPWACENEEKMKLELTVTRERKRRWPKSVTLASNLPKIQSKGFN